MSYQGSFQGNRRAIGQTIRMAVNRIAWSLTTAMFLIAALVLFLSGYKGYGGVFIAVAVSAAINLVPVKRAPTPRAGV